MTQPMPHIFKRFHMALSDVLSELAEEGALPAGLDPAKVTVEPPRDASHGDISTNVGMVLSKPAGMKPRGLATLVGDRMRTLPALGIVNLSIDGPGFLNFRLAPSMWQGELATGLRAGLAYGDSHVGQGVRVNVEYVSANPTGPMHVGHCRGAVVGDVLASLLAKAGFDVVREYYINDAGAQVDVLARSAYHRYREALGDDMGAVPVGLYPGDYLVPLGQNLAQQYGDIWREADEAVWLETIRRDAIAAMLVLIKEDLAALGVRHDLFSSERAMVESGAVEASLAALEARGLIYVGVLEPPKGKTPDEWEPRPQTLFRATEFGDDVDRPLKKSDGSWTYFANDIAYHYDKAIGNPDRAGANILINIFGADHGGYVKRMVAAVKALTDGKVSLDIKLCQLVNLLDKGVPVKMSKRAGNFVTLREVVDEVGANAVRFIMLTRKNDVSLDFDFAKVQEQSKDNPVFYVQYAHARATSVMRNAVDSLSHDQLSPEHLANSSLNRLTDETELGLMRTLASWPRLVEAAAEAHEPHRIAFYLGEVAAGFHALWNKGRDEASLRFILPDDPDLTVARLALVQGVKSVIASGLAILGVKPVEEMR